MFAMMGSVDHRGQFVPVLPHHTFERDLVVPRGQHHIVKC
jgi:hypothetical protein